VCWGTYRLEESGERTKMWCPCKVLRVADGESDKGSHGKGESSRARKLLPAGALLVEWEPDPERAERGGECDCDVACAASRQVVRAGIQWASRMALGSTRYAIPDRSESEACAPSR
jgi:hypothetical protein